MLMEAEIAGGTIAAVYYCPHDPDVACHCRKPETGMLERAVREWGGYERTFMVGDKESDMQAAGRFGIPGYPFKGGSLLDFVRVIVKEDV
jgi:histidinol phosphatase-like enzyme